MVVSRSPRQVEKCKRKMRALMTPGSFYAGTWRGRSPEAYREMCQMRDYFQSPGVSSMWHPDDLREMLAYWKSVTTVPE